MTSDDILPLVTEGGSLTVEFKRGRGNLLNDDLIVEAVVCLANGSGGLLLLGVEDDGRITGLDPRHGASPWKWSSSSSNTKTRRNRP